MGMLGALLKYLSFGGYSVENLRGCASTGISSEVPLLLVFPIYRFMEEGLNAV